MQTEGIVLPAADVRRAIVETSLVGGFAPQLMGLFMPRLAEVGLESRTVYGISTRGEKAGVYEHVVMCDATSGMPVDGVVEIINALPEPDDRKDLLILGSRYFASPDLAHAFAQWRDSVSPVK